MTLTCEYCRCACDANLTKCPNCSAPVSQDAAPIADYRHCPYCSRLLLALGSPACSYCGRRLPDSFIRAREGDLKRLADLQTTQANSQLKATIDELLRHPGRQGRREQSVGDILNIRDLTDLF